MNAPAAVWTPTDMARKRRMIARLDAGELRGWFDAMRAAMGAPPFDGELAALQDRARELGVVL